MTSDRKTIPQDYPRIQEEHSRYYGCLDDSKLVQHSTKISAEKFKELVLSAISNASKKSSREILSISTDLSQKEIEDLYIKEGKKLFAYFKKFCGDPAATAHQTYKKNYRDIGIEQFRNRTLQKERMNSGWRYQFLAHDCASYSKRFKNISDIGAAEADFNATIQFLDNIRSPLNLYVSIKNRVNTMGGQDWPKAIQALENIAKNDKNRTGPYCCVFGIAMDRGMRHIKRIGKSSNAHSVNTEVWLSDYFWPFFANYTYEEVMTAVLEVLVSEVPTADLSTQIPVPEKLLDSFGSECKKASLLDEDGNFNNPYKLVKFFCRKDQKQ